MYKSDYPHKKINNYIPLQPSFEIIMDHYIELRRGRDSLSQDIALYYQFRTNKDSGNSILVVPDGCIDLVFCCNPKKFSAHIYGTVLQSKQIIFEENSEYFGVRYLPEQEIYLMKELIDKQIPLIDIISSAFGIIDKIASAQSFQERIKILGDLINRSTLKINTVPKIVSYSIKAICSAKGNLNIDLLAQETGYSNRYLRKRFEEFVGLSPKFYSEIIRFQNSLSMVIDSKNYDYWDIISENGYYDQSHFINQFKKFSKLTPAKMKNSFFA
ncbi:MAG: helix-turn-helix domain-containing protein [Desulfitobacteriaceae bacterium]